MNEPGRRRQKPRDLIHEAALSVFSQNGFRGSTIDQIAEAAGLSKPNVLYYFPSKEAIYVSALTGMLDQWLAPMRAIDPAGEPLDEILTYVRRKLDLSRDYPRESRLFANEILQGAPLLSEVLDGELRDLVDATSALVGDWIAQGRIAPVDPRHLIFSVWALTQHYADFEVQVRAVLGEGHDPYAEAGAFLDNLYRRMLAPAAG